jgi:hypothetical protein
MERKTKITVKDLKLAVLEMLYTMLLVDKETKSPMTSYRQSDSESLKALIKKWAVLIEPGDTFSDETQEIIDLVLSEK